MGAPRNGMMNELGLGAKYEGLVGNELFEWLEKQSDDVIAEAMHDILEDMSAGAAMATFMLGRKPTFISAKTLDRMAGSMS